MSSRSQYNAGGWHEHSNSSASAVGPSSSGCQRYHTIQSHRQGNYDWEERLRLGCNAAQSARRTNGDIIHEFGQHRNISALTSQSLGSARIRPLPPLPIEAQSSDNQPKSLKHSLSTPRLHDQLNSYSNNADFMAFRQGFHEGYARAQQTIHHGDSPPPYGPACELKLNNCGTRRAALRSAASCHFLGIPANRRNEVYLACHTPMSVVSLVSSESPSPTVSGFSHKPQGDIALSQDDATVIVKRPTGSPCNSLAESRCNAVYDQTTTSHLSEKHAVFEEDHSEDSKCFFDLCDDIPEREKQRGVLGFRFNAILRSFSCRGKKYQQ